MSNIASNKLGNNGGRNYSFLNKPVTIDCNFIVDNTNGNGLGIRSLKGSGVQAVYMHTTATPAAGNPNPAAGYALIQLSNNYNRYAGGFSGFVSPLSGSNLAINATALTIGNPYVITSVGAPTAGTVTVAPVADVSGSLASTYFSLYDAYGNTFVIWFYVTGVGGNAPNLGPAAAIGQPGISYIQQTIASGSSAATIGAALVNTINLLPSDIAGVYSFTSSGTTTVTIVSTGTGPLPGGPADGTISTGFTFAVTKDQTNLQNWQAVGLNKGVTPAVGAAFIATATGYSSRGGSTGLVQAPSISGLTSIEVIGDPNQTFAPIPMGGSPNVGGYILVQFLAATNSSTTTLVPTAPAAGSIVSLTFQVEAGSILISGE